MKINYIFSIYILLLLTSCGVDKANGQSIIKKETLAKIDPSTTDNVNSIESEEILSNSDATFAQKLAAAGEAIEDASIVYDPSYVSLKYPGGDVSADRGVCTDVIIRAYRIIDIDLQKKVHEDILKEPSAYSRVDKPDYSIDHRRVPNLAVFFTRHGKKLSVTENAQDYKPGDIIWWELGGKGGVDHIGLVVNKKSKDGKRYLVIHNVGGGQALEDFLFHAYIKGHYSYEP